MRLDSENKSARFNLASSALAQGAWAEAVTQFGQLLRRDPHNIGAKLLQAVALQRSGQLSAAAELLKDVLGESTENATALNNLAYLYASQGTDLDRASVLVDRALKANGNNPFYLDTKGLILHQQGKDREALSYLQRAHDKAPNDQAIKDHLAAAAVRAGRSARGVPPATPPPGA